MEERLFLDEMDNLVHVIKGECFGVAITKMSHRETDLGFVMLVHDDGNWFDARGEYSSFWIPDIRRVMAEAEKWLNEHATVVDDKTGRYYYLKEEQHATALQTG